MPEVRDLDPADCLSPPSNRPIRDDDLAELLEDIRLNGQQTPIIAAPHLTLVGKYLVACGNRRTRCQGILGNKVRAEVRDKPFAPGEIVKISVADHLKGKRPNVFELCAELSHYKREMKLATWAEVGSEAHLNLPASTISRILGVRRYTDELRAMTDGLVGTTVQIIGKLPTHDMMRKALEFASTPDANGNLPSKEKVEREIKRLKGVGKPGRKKKNLEGKFDGRKFSVELLDKDDAARLAEWHRAVAKRLEKSAAEMQPEGWGFLFA